MNLIKKVFSKFKNKKFFIPTLMISMLLVITFFVIRTKAVTPANPAFDDYNFYKCVIDAYNNLISYDDVEYNHNLSDSELQEIKHLTCNGSKVADSEKIISTNGLEKLTNLLTLDLKNNKISTINLSTNTKISNLTLSFNNLSIINLRNNPQLTTLDLGYNNLNNLDLTQNVNLNYLRLEGNYILSLNLSNQSKLNQISFLTEKDFIVDKTTTTLDLKQYDSNLDPSKVVFTPADGVTYNNQSGVFTINDEVQKINYKYRTGLPGSTGLSEEIPITLNLYFPPKVSSFYAGSDSTYKYTKSNPGMVTINWNSLNVTHYCVTETNNSDSCDWKSVDSQLKTISPNFTFSERDGSKTLYAFLKDNLGRISDSYQASTILDTTNPTIDKFYIGGNSNPYYATSTASNVYLSWNDDDVKYYCINNIDRSYSCDWKPVSGKSITTDYNLTDGYGTKTLYAFIKDDADRVSEVKKDEIIFSKIPEINSFYVGGSNNPKYATSTASKVYLKWADTDIKQYCISTTNNNNNCSWKSANGISVIADYTLTSGDENKTLYAFLKNNDGVISAEKKDEIILDTTDPTIDKFYIGGSNNPEYATSIVTSIYLSWSDGDVKQYCVSTTSNSDSCDWQATDGKSTTASYLLANGIESQRAYAFIKDESGHISEVKEDTIKLDTYKPKIDTFYVGGLANPEYVTDPNTTVYLTWNDDDVVSYCINTSDSANGCNWQNTTNKSVSDSYTIEGGSGNKTLYAFIKDRAGNISEEKEDSIRLDSDRPIIEKFYIGGENNPEYATDTNSKVYLTWQDDDVTDYCISTTDSSNNCEWIKTSGKSVNAEYILQGTNGEITLYAFIRDSVGLISNSKMDKITLSTTKPLIEVFYIGGSSNPKYATSTSSSIYLKWTEENIKNYCISTTNSSASCDWKTASEKSVNTSYTLANGDGTKRLYAYIKNAAGLVSNVASDNIILDTTKPTIDKFYIGGINNPKYTNNKNASIYATWQDNDVVSYCVSETKSSADCKWENASGKVLNTTYSLTSASGEKKLYLYIKDESGHISEVKEDSIILDTKIPVIKEFYIADKNTTKITDNKTKITIIHEEDDVESYCISETNSYLSCNWIKSKDKKIEAEYTLPIGNGTKTLYAFIKDEAGNISLLKLAKIDLEMPGINLNTPDENNVDTPLNSSPQTGSKVIGIITITVILISLVSIIILKRRNKLYKL